MLKSVSAHFDIAIEGDADNLCTDDARSIHGELIVSKCIGTEFNIVVKDQCIKRVSEIARKCRFADIHHGSQCLGILDNHLAVVMCKCMVADENRGSRQSNRRIAAVLRTVRPAVECPAVNVRITLREYDFASCDVGRLFVKFAVIVF